MSIDLDGLKARTDIVAVVSAYTRLKKIGVEFCGPCPIHGGEGDNFYVNPRKGIWACFSRNCHECEEGNDVIGFIRKVESLPFVKACEFLGATNDWKPCERIVQKAEPPPERVTSKPPPGAGAPDMNIRQYGAPSRVWPYRDADGAPLGYVARYEHQDGKQIRCWTWAARPGEAPAWTCCHFSKPRPLYGLDRLAAKPQASVLVVEGEKAADAAAALLPSYAVITWPGGAQAWKHADLKPLAGRKVLLWPDADEPGKRCMENLAHELSDPRVLACSVRIICPEGMPDGFDAADWTGSMDELIAWAKPRASDYHHAEARKHGLTQDVPPHDDLPPVEAYEDEGAATSTRKAPPKVNGHAALGEVYYRRMSEIESRAIDWLWPGRFAKGKVSMVVGNPGLGKSQLCASIVSVVSNGGSWPVDRTPCARGSVVILSAEDDPEDTIRPRLEASGADLDRVVILDAIRVERQDGAGKRGFDLSVDIARLGALLHELGDAALVIIDPITAYLGDADSHKNAEVRALLAPLSEMAAAQRVAIIAVSHLTKSAGMDALLRVQGSIGFAAAARAVWGVAKDKENPARRLFMPLKNNLGTDESGFAYSVAGVRLPESDIETSHIMWENALVLQSADDVFGGQNLDHEERSLLGDAKEFVKGLLSEGPVLSEQVERDAKGAGHNMATVRRAAKELKVQTYREGFGKSGKWYWRIRPFSP